MSSQEVAWALKAAAPSLGSIPNPRLARKADPVIEAIARLEFEDGLRTGLGGC